MSISNQTTMIPSPGLYQTRCGEIVAIVKLYEKNIARDWCGNQWPRDNGRFGLRKHIESPADIIRRVADLPEVTDD